jgi:predicted DNA-binding transcriptional regulator AlpA
MKDKVVDFQSLLLQVTDFKGLIKLGIALDKPRKKGGAGLYSRTQIDRMMKDGRFPQSFPKASRNERRMWWLHQIHEWLQCRAEGRPYRPVKTPPKLPSELQTSI